MELFAETLIIVELNIITTILPSFNSNILSKSLQKSALLEKLIFRLKASRRKSRISNRSFYVEKNT